MLKKPSGKVGYMEELLDAWYCGVGIKVGSDGTGSGERGQHLRAILCKAQDGKTGQIHNPVRS